MRSLNIEEKEEVQRWLETFELSNTRKVFQRDFSDAVLVAKVLKQLYPKLVELHNYPARNAFNLKLDNWITLNRKVLTKLDLTRSRSVLERYCQFGSGEIETFFFDLMKKYQEDLVRDQEIIKKNGGGGGDDENNEVQIMNISVERKSIDGTVEQILQPMVTYSMYEKAQCTVHEQTQAIAILKQKIDHMDNMLKLKCQRIDDLLGQLARKSRRPKLEETSSSANDVLSLKFN